MYFLILWVLCSVPLRYPSTGIPKGLLKRMAPSIDPLTPQLEGLSSDPLGLATMRSVYILEAQHTGNAPRASVC